MFRKSKRFVLAFLAGLLAFSPALSNPALAASNANADGKITAANPQQKSKALETRGITGANISVNPPKGSNKTRKSQLPATSSAPEKTAKKSSKIYPVKNSTNQKIKGKYASDELIIKFKNKVTADNVRQKFSLKTHKQFKSIGAEVVKIPKGSSVEGLISKIKADPSVAYVQPNYKYQRSDLPNDPLFNQLWGLHNTGQQVNGSSGTVNMDIGYINAMQEMNQLTSVGQVVIGVIDTGVDINHPDLKNHIWTNPKEIPGDGIDNDGNGYIDDVHGWDFFNEDNTVFDQKDGDDHGTHVSGTIAAESNNSIGVAGIAQNVKIMPLKFLGPNGGYSSDAILAIEYAKNMGVKITNNSWSGPDYDQALKDAIDNSNILIVAAAGNDDVDIDQTPTYPAAYNSPNIISVAALDKDGSMANFSNYGYNNVDIAAPGVDILSTVPSQQQEGLAAQINGPGNYKAIYNGFGFEHLTDSDRLDAFQRAMSHLGATSSSKILLVQDDESDTAGIPSYLDTYKTLLGNAGYTYSVTKVLTDENGPTLTTLNQYDIVIWFTGDAMGHTNPNLTSADLNTLDQFLKAGNKSLLLSGQDLLYRNEGASFVTSTLALNYTGEGQTSGQIEGVTGTVYDGKHYQLNPVQYADYITSSNSAVSTINLNLPGDSTYQNAYAYYSGTSMATPHVTGVAGLLAGKYPDMDPATLKSVILASGDDENNLTGWIHTGKKLNAYNALTYNLENLDNEIPGTTLTNNSVDGRLDAASDTDDVYAVHLNAGETMHANLTGDASTDFDLYLFSPDAQTVNNSGNMLAHSETPGSSTENIDYVAQTTGTYYLDVFAYAGSGNYTLSVASGNGVGTYEDDSPTMNYIGTWTSVSNAAYSNGTAHQLNSAGKLNFTFVGSKIQWNGFKNADQGIADVYIDGTLEQSVSLYAATLSAQKTLFEKIVPYGKHVITINWTGNYDLNARKSSTAINVDQIVVSENLTVPTGLKVSYDSQDKMQPYVQWDTGGTADYNVYRKEKGQDDNSYTKLNNSPVTANYYYDSTAVSGKTYEYAVTAAGSQGSESAKTAPVEYTYDDQIPGLAVSGTSITGSVDNANDYLDVLAVHLDAGQTYSFSFNGTAGTDFDYRLYGPTATNVYSDSALRIGNGNTSEDYFTYPVTQSGTYYIVVNASTGSGQYSIQMGSKPTVNNTDIPNAVSLNGTSSVSDFLDSYNPNDVYSVDLAAGDTLTLNLSSTATNGNDFNLSLYGPSAVTINPGSTNYVNAIAYSNQLNTPTESITYTAMNAGKYYIDVSALTGEGPYTLTIGVQKTGTGEPVVTRVEDSNPLIKYSGSWKTDSSSSYSGGTFKYINTKDASAELSFTGTGIRWFSLTSPYYGLADVFIDGQFINQVNLYSSSVQYKQLIFEKLNLSNGVHTIKIVARGEKGNTSGMSTYIGLDAFEIIQDLVLSVNKFEDTDLNIKYSGSWKTDSSSSYSGGTFKYINTKDASAELSFTGTGIRWFSLTSPYYGLADVFIDGQFINQVNLYSSTVQYKQLIFEKLNLSSGVHTIKIVARGEKGNTSGMGTYIGLDAFEILTY